MTARGNSPTRTSFFGVWLGITQDLESNTWFCFSPLRNCCCSVRLPGPVVPWDPQKGLASAVAAVALAGAARSRWPAGIPDLGAAQPAPAVPLHYVLPDACALPPRSASPQPAHLNPPADALLVRHSLHHASPVVGALFAGRPPAHEAVQGFDAIQPGLAVLLHPCWLAH